MSVLETISVWLCPTSMDRERLVDMNVRVAVARRVQGGTLGLAASTVAAYAGWWRLAFVVLAVAVLAGLELLLKDSRRPELSSATSMALLEVILAGGAATTGGAQSPMLAWLCVPVVMLAARFRAAVVSVGLIMGTSCACLAVVGAGQFSLTRQPPPTVQVLCWMALVISLVAAIMALLSAELQSRGAALIDPLTGLGNRLALAPRLAQTMEQARVLDAWVSVVMCDLDHFKDVNDTYGHDAGDNVLRAVAYEMREELGSFDAVYRLGGEEFLVLLAGVQPAQARVITERLRAAIATRPVGGVTVTMSAGVASARGSSAVGDELIRDADQALYAAKGSGRNRVCVASGTIESLQAVTVM